VTNNSGGRPGGGRNSGPCTCCQAGCNRGADQPANPGHNGVNGGASPPHAAPLPAATAPVAAAPPPVVSAPPAPPAVPPRAALQAVPPAAPTAASPPRSPPTSSESPETPIASEAAENQEISDLPPMIPAPEPPSSLELASIAGASALEPKSTQTSPTKPKSNSSTQTLNNFAVTFLSANLPPFSLTQEVPDVSL
jgi:hypothetical protein